MIKWIIPIIILIVFEGLADYFAKKWSLETSNIKIAGIALLGYMLGNTAWLIALKNGVELSNGAVIFSVMSAVIAVMVGTLIYHEPTTTMEIIGLCLGVVAIILLSL